MKAIRMTAPAKNAPTKIVKLLGHLSVDLLFKETFGPDLRIYDLHLPTDFRTDWRYAHLEATDFPLSTYVHPSFAGALGVGYALREQLGLYRPDVFIVDDPFSLFVARQVRAKQLVWYCHGDFTSAANPNNPFLRHYFEDLGDAPTLYATEFKRARNETWRQPRRSRVVPLALPAQAFASDLVPAPLRNGCLAVTRNDILRRQTRAPGGLAGLTALATAFAKRLHLFGYNEPDPRFEALHLGGYVSPLSDLRDYTVAVEPFGEGSPSCVLLEMLAAGVPVVTFPREGLTETTAAFRVAHDPDGLVAAARDALASPTDGAAAREWAQARHGSAAWSAAVREFFDAL